MRQRESDSADRGQADISVDRARGRFVCRGLQTVLSRFVFIAACDCAELKDGAAFFARIFGSRV